jgi:hypothetical protein
MFGLKSNERASREKEVRSHGTLSELAGHAEGVAGAQLPSPRPPSRKLGNKCARYSNPNSQRILKNGKPSFYLNPPVLG